MPVHLPIALAAFALVTSCLTLAQDLSFEPVTTKRCVKKATSNSCRYTIAMAGTADMDNSTTREYQTFSIAFQNNVSLTIANTGPTTVVHPRVITNGRRRWWCMEELLKEILAGAKTDQDKALLIYDFVRRHRHHDDPIFYDDNLHDPVKMLNVFGAGLCDDSGYVGCSLFHHAGLGKDKYGKTPSERCLHGHMMCEAILDNGYQFLDIDENTFYLDLENERPVSGDAIVRDHYLAKREHAYGPMFKGWTVGEGAASLFGRDDGSTFRAAAGHRIEFCLRPGERIVYRWDHCGKFASDDTRGKRKRRFWGTSLWQYEPVLATERVSKDAVAVHGIVQATTRLGPALAGEGRDSHLIYEMATPYAVCGGRLTATFRGRHTSDRFTVAVSADGKTWVPVWRQAGAGVRRCRVELDKAIGCKRGTAKFAYRIKIGLASSSHASASLRALAVETDLMTSPHALPRLSLGMNRVEYTDETPEPHEVTITHCWRESGSVVPPSPPAEPIRPKPDETVQATTFPFEWPAVQGASLYHIQVSRRPDMRLSYRPCFDVFVKDTTHHAPFAGLFSPGVQYYWRVRVRGEPGLWGPWSPVWRFRWEGPRVPADLRRTIRAGKITLSWKANPRGPKPVRYDVYGSDERGFTPSKKPYRVKGLGRQPANFLCTTTDTERVVVAEGAEEPAMNRSFYRVVATDAHGVESGPSELIELPHPFLFSRPVATAAFGQRYQYQLRSLRCLGDLQHRYAKPGQKFWEEEGCRFELAAGPKWLRLDQDTGLLSGTPARADAGEHRVRIVCHRAFPHELKPGDYRCSYFLKDDPRFQAKHEQTFTLRVQAGPAK